MNDDIEIKLFDGLNNTPALDLAIRGWAECVEKNLGDGTLNVYWSHKAFVAYAMNGKEQLPVAVMTWEHIEHTKTLWVNQSYTIPEFRGRGCYNALWNAVVAKAIELKVTSVQSGTHIRNEAMRKIAKKQGRYEEFVTLRFNLGTE